MDHDMKIQDVMNLVTAKGISVERIGNYHIKIMEGLYLVMSLAFNRVGNRYLQGQFCPSRDFDLDVRYFRRGAIGLIGTDAHQFCGRKGGFRIDDFPEGNFVLYGAYYPERSIETPAHWLREVPRRRPNIIHIEPSERLIRARPPKVH